VSRFWSAWGLRLLALALAVLAWFILSVGQREQSSETTVEVFVTYLPPEDFMILESPDRVRVRLQGPESEIAALNPFQVTVVVELRDAELGRQEVVLTGDNVVAPGGLQVVSIDPNVLTLQLDHEVSELKPIDAQLVGEPAAGAVAQEPTVFPLQALVTGPESKVSALAALTTTPINLNGHALDFQTQAAVISPDPLVRVVEPSVVRVDVRLDIPGQQLEPGTPPSR
jgi:YbbR domain-containing protein